MSTEISKVAVYVEIAGKAYLVALPQDRLQLAIKMISGLSDDGQLPVRAAPDMKFWEAA